MNKKEHYLHAYKICKHTLSDILFWYLIIGCIVSGLISRIKPELSMIVPFATVPVIMFFFDAKAEPACRKEGEDETTK